MPLASRFAQTCDKCQSTDESSEMDEDSVALVRDRLTISEVVEVLRDPAQYSVITQPPQRPKAGHVYVFSWKDHPSQKGNCTCMHTYRN